VIDLCFGKLEHSYHILVELYGQGNVILTDHEYTILSLLRSHKFDETSKIQIREKYPFNAAANMTVDSIFINPEEIKAFIEGANQQTEVQDDNQVVNNEAKSGGSKKQEKKGGKQQKSQKKEVNLKSILTKMVPYINFRYAEHILKTMGIDPNLPATLE